MSVERESEREPMRYGYALVASLEAAQADDDARAGGSHGSAAAIRSGASVAPAGLATVQLGRWKRF